MILGMDSQIFYAVNNLAGRSHILDLVGIFLASYSQYILVIVLLIVLFYPKESRNYNQKMIAVSLLAALIARFVVKTLIVLLYQRQRPFVNSPLVHHLISTRQSQYLQSFPSGHMIFLFALGTSLFLFNKRLGTFTLILSTIIGLARIYVGVHWPSDIVGGALIGAITSVIVYLLYKQTKYFKENNNAKLERL
jgi:undecaprenyl-diphosphatase